MTKIKALIAIAAAFLLSACAEEPLIDPQVSSAMFVQDVVVDTNGFAGVTGRAINVPATQVRADITRALSSRLRGRGNPGGTPVVVTVNVDRVSLVSPGQSLLVGGISTATGTVSIVELASQTSLLAPTQVVGTGDGYAPGGVIGAASRGSPQSDYTQTITRFAETVATELFGPAAASGSSASPAVASPTLSTAPGANNANSLRESAWQL
ncbi:hypothetical protein SLH49_21410 [Cognatiyoonia sp. IB215446]|uniref:hypothetical protein n=1 Tax=Cognatiyoonia sp. IB215446 TaxID=3097355 RepID=UPI002A0C0D81|nr:hypothetical protein [Cognatiyoonia sp. IB215446]MDX8350556.1 hypothetical protein [Cognatiyoonia sp. IB215446]